MLWIWLTLRSTLGQTWRRSRGGSRWSPVTACLHHPLERSRLRCKIWYVTRKIANQNTACTADIICFYTFRVGASRRREPWRPRGRRTWGHPGGDKFYEIQNWHWLPNFSWLEMMETLGCRGWLRSSWKLDRGPGCPPSSSKTDSFCSDPKKLMDTLLVACAISYT